MRTSMLLPAEGRGRCKHRAGGHRLPGKREPATNTVGGIVALATGLECRIRVVTLRLEQMIEMVLHAVGGVMRSLLKPAWADRWNRTECWNLRNGNRQPSEENSRHLAWSETRAHRWNGRRPEPRPRGRAPDLGVPVQSVRIHPSQAKRLRPTQECVHALLLSEQR